jgi:hypothetical protein
MKTRHYFQDHCKNTRMLYSKGRTNIYFTKKNSAGGMAVSFVGVVYFEVEVYASGWSRFQKIPTEYGASLCVIYRRQELGNPGPRWESPNNVEQLYSTWRPRFLGRLIPWTSSRRQTSTLVLLDWASLFHNFSRSQKTNHWKNSEWCKCHLTIQAECQAAGVIKFWLNARTILEQAERVSSSM